MRLAALAPWWERGTRWWEERSLREQILLGILSALAMLALLLVGFVRPLESVRARAAAQIRNSDMLEARLRSSRPVTQAAGSVSDLVAQSASAAGLPVQQMSPENGAVRITLGDAPFADVVRWISTVERSNGLRVVEARVARASAGNGIVSASFLFAR